MKAPLPLLLLLVCVVSCLGDPKADDPKSNPKTIDLTLVPGKQDRDLTLLTEKRNGVKVGGSSPTPTPAPNSTTPSQPRQTGINYTWIVVTVIVWLILRTIVHPRNRSR